MVNAAAKNIAANIRYKVLPLCQVKHNGKMMRKIGEINSMAGHRAVNRPPGVRAKWFVGDQTIGIGKIELLEKIEQHGSISAAAREMGMGYRRAWTLLDSLQRCFSAPLVETARGGNAHGGAVVTPLGRELIQRFVAYQSEIHSNFNEIADWLQTIQADMDDPAGVTKDQLSAASKRR
jgi:molybdate transport system regulatory protein